MSFKYVIWELHTRFPQFPSFTLLSRIKQWPRMVLPPKWTSCPFPVPTCMCPDRPLAHRWAGLMQPLLQSPDLGLPHPSHRDLVTATLTHMWLSVTSCGLWSPEPAARLLSSSHCWVCGSNARILTGPPRCSSLAVGRSHHGTYLLCHGLTESLSFRKDSYGCWEVEQSRLSWLKNVGNWLSRP